MINNKYVRIYWQNPLRTYNKIKQYFLPLKPKIQFGAYKWRDAKILEFNAFDVTWKDKYNSPRHEYDPRIELTLFNYFRILITFEVKGQKNFDSMVYWEAALSWLYYKQHLPKTLQSTSGWKDFVNGKEVPIKFTLLREPWQSLYNQKLLPKIYYESTIQ